MNNHQWNKSDTNIRIFLGGDVMTGRTIDQLFAVHNLDDFGKTKHIPSQKYHAWSASLYGAESVPVGHNYIWGTALDIFNIAKPDFRLINLEVAITQSDDWERKDFNFRMHPANTPCLSAASIDCCSLANNHILDFGRAGLEETIHSLQTAGIGYTGAGSNSDVAQKPYVHLLPDGGRILVFSWGFPDSGIFPHWQAEKTSPGVNYVANFSKKSAQYMVNQINIYRKPGDIIIASLHWGKNWISAIPAAHRRLAHYLIDNGSVSIIHGHSSHHPTGIEIYKNRPIFYGCGDLINDYEGNPKYRPLKHHLGLLYFIDINKKTGVLQDFKIVPVQRRRFRLEAALSSDFEWLSRRMKNMRFATK